MSALDDGDRAAAGAADVDQVGLAAGAGQYQPAPAAAQRPRGHQGVDQRPARRRPEQRQVASVSGSSAAAQHRCGPSTYGLSGSRTRGLTGRPNSASGGGRGRCPAGRRGRPGPPGRLALAGPARPACCHSEAGCPGSRRSARRPGRRCRCRARARWWRPARAARPAQAPLQRAPLLGQVAAAVGRDPAGQASGRPRRAGRRAVAATSSAPRRDRTKASVRTPSSTQVGEQVGGLGGGAAAHRRAVLAAAR